MILLGESAINRGGSAAYQSEPCARLVVSRRWPSRHDNCADLDPLTRTHSGGFHLDDNAVRSIRVVVPRVLLHPAIRCFDLSLATGLGRRGFIVVRVDDCRELRRPSTRPLSPLSLPRLAPRDVRRLEDVGHDLGWSGKVVRVVLSESFLDQRRRPLAACSRQLQSTNVS